MAGGGRGSGDLGRLVDGLSGKAHDALGLLGASDAAAGISGMLGQAVHQAQDAISHGSSAGHGAYDRATGVGDRARKVGLKKFKQYVPGGEALIDEVESLWKSDVPGGFQAGHAVDIARCKIPGIRGFMFQSTPDGGEYFIAEEFGPLHCCCCWAGRGPTYRVLEGNPLHQEEVLVMQSHRCCCCANPWIEVFDPQGGAVAVADERALCCCVATTHLHVRGEQGYRLRGNLLGACCSCFTSQHEIQDSRGRDVGQLVHWNDGAHIQFPPDARASDKASLLAAALLTDLRRR